MRGGIPFRGAGLALAIGLMVLAIAIGAAPVLAQPSPQPSPQPLPQAVPPAAQAPGPGGPPPLAAPGKAFHAGRLSKFEARHIRHFCRDSLKERGLKGGERDAFLMKCYFGRVSQRALRHECRREGEAKGVEKNALRDYTRACVKERATRQKD